MREFKTESRKLLDLMINSIYTNREIFLRELISNASDAEDKLYFKGLTDPNVEVSRSDLTIRVAFDPTARTITISDSGIGMTEEQLDRNLGTIAHSDSQAFKQERAAEGAPASPAASDAGSQPVDAASASPASDQAGSSEEPEAADREPAAPEVDIIGQFGVGFYSAFMVASKVRVVSRAYGSDQAFAWESDGVEGYTIEPAEKAAHGTDVILMLKPNSDDESYDEFLTEHGLQELIRRYSNYVRYPIQMECTHSRQKPKPDDAPDDYTPEWETYTSLDTVNSMVPIWKKRASEVTDQEYAEFYKAQFHDFSDPARRIVVHAEGALSYDVLAFIPSRAPFDLYSKEYQKGLALYSSNVLIMEKCEELLPDYFNFVRGVVDSQDLTLNISRETLQHNSQLRAIAKRVEKKVASELRSMRDNDREEYERFFENFGRGLKYGIYSSYGMDKDKLADLLLFYSAKQQRLVTLDEYLAAMPDGAEKVFYAAGDSIERLGRMPVVTSVLAAGHDVLLCTQDVDDFCLQAMAEYQGKQLKNVASGDLGIESEADKEAAEAAAQEHKELMDALGEALEGKVARVSATTRTSDAPAFLVAEGPISFEMEKVMAGMPDGGDIRSTRVLELNTKHAVFSALAEAQAAGDSEKVSRFANLLYNQALLVEGLPIDDPVAFAQDICSLMK